MYLVGCHHPRPTTEELGWLVVGHVKHMQKHVANIYCFNIIATIKPQDNVEPQNADTYSGVFK